MPRSADPTLSGGRGLPQNRNPLVRINYQPPKVVVDPAAVLQQWVQWLETYGLAAVEEVTGLDLTQLRQFFEAVDFGDTFDLETAWRQFINGALRPTHLLVSTDDVLGGGGGGVGFPWTFPINFGEPDSPLRRQFTNLWRLINSDLSVTGLDLDGVLSNFILTRLLPQGQLGSLIDGIQPDSEAPQILREFLAKIANIVIPGSATPSMPILDLWTKGWQAFLKLFNLTSSNQAQITQVASQVAASPTGSLLTVVPMSLAPFAVTYYGQPGAGGTVTVNDGVMSWDPAGVVDRLALAHHSTALATDYGAVRLTMPQAVQQALNGSEAYAYLRGRVNLANTSDVHARIGYSTAAIGFRLNSFNQVIGPVVTGLVNNPNDEWEFRFGTTANVREFSLCRNGVPIIPSVVDTGNNSLLAANGNIYPGWALQAASRSFSSGQTLPGTVSGFTAYDVDV